jgi:hypothetical protein
MLLQKYGLIKQIFLPGGASVSCFVVFRFLSEVLVEDELHTELVASDSELLPPGSRRTHSA